MKTNQFQKDRYIQERTTEKDYNELEDRKRRNKNILMNAILISLGLIAFITSFPPLFTDYILIGALLFSFAVVCFSLGFYRLYAES